MSYLEILIDFIFKYDKYNKYYINIIIFILIAISLRSIVIYKQWSSDQLFLIN
jgi:hypothetical protein